MGLAFLLTTLVVVATPGTGVVHTLAAGLSQGRRASVVAAFACTLGIVPHVLAPSPGSPRCPTPVRAPFQILKYAGVAYLLYMAWATVRDKNAIAVATFVVFAGYGTSLPPPSAAMPPHGRS